MIDYQLNPCIDWKNKTKQKDQQDIFWSRQDGWARSQNFNPRLRFTRRNRQGIQTYVTFLPHNHTPTLHLVTAHYRCNQPMSPLQLLAKGAPPTPDLAFNTTSPSTWRPFAIIRVNTRPKDMEGSGGLSVLKKPKCQNVTRCQQPAALICRPLDDAHLIVSLGNLLEVSKRFPMSALQLLGSIIAARKKENWAGSVRCIQSGLREARSPSQKLLFITLNGLWIKFSL